MGTVYVNSPVTDMYLVDIATGAITRGSTLQLSSAYNFNENREPWNLHKTGKKLAVKFTGQDAYPKKKYLGAVIYAYVTQKATSAGSGTLPQDSHFNFNYGLSNWLGLDDSVYQIPEWTPDSAGKLDFSNWTSGVNLYQSLGKMYGVQETDYETELYAQPWKDWYNNVTYNPSLSLTVQGLSGPNAPYIRYQYEDVVVNIKNAYPVSGFINERVTNVFGWDFYVPFMADTFVRPVNLNQKSAKFRWRVFGETAYNEIVVTGSQKTITLPAETFPSTAQYVEWQVVVTTDDDVEGTPSAWFKLSLTDSTPGKPEIVSPRSTFIDGAAANRFQWIHKISTGSTQKKYDLQYSTNSGTTWVDLSSEETPNNYYDVAANTFAAGTVLWRVRTYNSDGVAGDWSDAATIVVRSSPPAPGIASVTNKPRPTITWQSAEQQAYQVKAGGYYDSELVYGVEKELKIPVFLPDGNQEVFVRVQNVLGLWSEWSSVTIPVKNVPWTIEFSVKRYNNGVQLSCSAGFTEYQYYRDGELIAKTADPTFIDYLSNGKHSYQVYGVNSDNYTKTTVITEIIYPAAAVISPVDAINWVTLTYKRGAYPTHDLSDDQEISYQHYSGRPLPVAEIGEAVNVPHILAFSAPREVSDKIQGMRGKKVVYKDNTGDIAIGILNGFRRSRGAYRPTTGTFDFDIQFTITEIGGVSGEIF